MFGWRGSGSRRALSFCARNGRLTLTSLQLTFAATSFFLLSFSVPVVVLLLRDVIVFCHFSVKNEMRWSLIYNIKIGSVTLVPRRILIRLNAVECKFFTLIDI